MTKKEKKKLQKLLNKKMAETEMAEALYKQVPQKIVCEESERYICPRCKAFLAIGTDAAELLYEDGAYCVDCGQRVEL